MANSKRPAACKHQTACTTPWTLVEDEQLRLAVSQCGFRDWYSVARYFNNTRSARDYKDHWGQLQHSRRRSKQHWQPREDRAIEQLVEVFGAGKWGQIAKHLPGRSSKQCRERWCYHLDPAVSHAPWTNDEDARILRLQQQHGNRWTKIARELSGRTDQAVRNHWHFSLLPRLKRDNWTASRRRLWEAAPASERPAGRSNNELEAMEYVLADTALADAVIRSLQEEGVNGEQSPQQNHAR